MARIEKTIDVRVPIRTAYDQWTQFESFPQFMEGVEEVRQVDDKRLEWRAKVAGKTEKWTADITEQMPDHVIAWQSKKGAENSGRVKFTPIDATTTKVTVEMGYDPKGVVEKAGDVMGFMDRRVEGDLKRFKTFIEERGAETGAWRGEIHGGQVEHGATS